MLWEQIPLDAVKKNLKEKFSINVDLEDEGFKENFSKRYHKDKKLLKIS